MRVSVVTYIYSGVVQYLPQFIKSLNNQNNTEFGLIVFNDGVKNADDYFKNNKFYSKIHTVTGTIQQIRMSSFDILKSDPAEAFIFQDADDMMSANRVAVLTEYIGKYNLVINDLNIADKNGDIIQYNIWSSRLENNFRVDADFIRDTNIIGFGNTALRKELLSIPILNAETIAVDWFIFYQLMERGHVHAVFTSECETIYRQHDGNTAGFKIINKDRIAYIIKVKKTHYHALESLGYDFSFELEKIYRLENLIKKKESIRLVKEIIPFWWEETEYIK